MYVPCLQGKREVVGWERAFGTILLEVNGGGFVCSSRVPLGGALLRQAALEMPEATGLGASRCRSCLAGKGIAFATFERGKLGQSIEVALWLPVQFAQVAMKFDFLQLTQTQQTKLDRQDSGCRSHPVEVPYPKNQSSELV